MLSHAWFVCHVLNTNHVRYRRGEQCVPTAVHHYCYVCCAQHVNAWLCYSILTASLVRTLE